MKRAAALLILTACATIDAQPQLMLDGPGQLRVDSLGPVDGPRAVLDDGSVPDGVLVTVEDAAVAEVEAGLVVARAPGETKVSATWNEQEVAWTLVVDPAMSLRILVSPSSMEPGEEAPIQIEARQGDDIVDDVQVEWVSSDEAVLTVEDGTVSASAPGVAYVTAKVGGSQAMLEIEVTD